MNATNGLQNWANLIQVGKLNFFWRLFFLFFSFFFLFSMDSTLDCSAADFISSLFTFSLDLVSANWIKGQLCRSGWNRVPIERRKRMIENKNKKKKNEYNFFAYIFPFPTCRTSCFCLKKISKSKIIRKKVKISKIKQIEILFVRMIELAKKKEKKKKQRRLNKTLVSL